MAPTHGVRATYIAGCRCDDCRAADLAYQRDLRARQATADVGLPRADWSWTAQAACRGTDPAMWFPESGQPIEPLRAICNDCRVAGPCLDTALAIGEDNGVWAGTSSRERRRLRRQRGLVVSGRPGGQPVTLTDDQEALVAAWALAIAETDDPLPVVAAAVDALTDDGIPGPVQRLADALGRSSSTVTYWLATARKMAAA